VRNPLTICSEGTPYICFPGTNGPPEMGIRQLSEAPYPARRSWGTGSGGRQRATSLSASCWDLGRVYGFLQFLARAEPMLGCDRQLVARLATQVGRLDALNARLHPKLEPLASWARTAQVELPDGDVRR